MIAPANFTPPELAEHAAMTAEEEAKADPDYAGPCPKCAGVFTQYRMGSYGGCDVSYRECDECGLQWDQT